MQNVIITDARYRMSLPLIRSLGKAGKHVICTDIEKDHGGKALGFHSKYTAETHLLPSADSSDFISRLQAVAGERRPVIVPVGIDTLLTLSSYTEEASAFADIALADIKDLHRADDKQALMTHAAEIGIPCPVTVSLRSGETAEQLAERISYPAVIKYRRGEHLGLDPQDRYQIVESAEALTAHYKRMHGLQAFPLVQEYVEGEGYGVSAIFDKSNRPYAVFCHKRLAEYPTSGGPSCLCESIWQPELVQYAVALLQSLNWVGPAMVEFKGNATHGWKLMEINPRFWGSLALAPAAGCDIAAAYYACARGEIAVRDAMQGPQYQVGRRLHFSLQYALSLPGYLRKSSHKVQYAFSHITALLNPFVKDGVFSLSDPKPGLAYLQQALKKRDKIIR